MQLRESRVLKSYLNIQRGRMRVSPQQILYGIWFSIWPRLLTLAVDGSNKPLVAIDTDPTVVANQQATN